MYQKRTTWLKVGFSGGSCSGRKSEDETWKAGYYPAGSPRANHCRYRRAGLSQQPGLGSVPPHPSFPRAARADRALPGGALPARNAAKPTTHPRASVSAQRSRTLATGEPGTAATLPKHRSRRQAAGVPILIRRDSRGAGPAAEPRTAGGASEAASGRKCRQKRAAVTTYDVQCPSRALAATAALDARGDAGAMRREPTKSRPAAAGRNGSPGAAGARGERTSSNAAGRVLALASALWHCGTAEHDANGYH